MNGDFLAKATVCTPYIPINVWLWVQAKPSHKLVRPLNYNVPLFSGTTRASQATYLQCALFSGTTKASQATYLQCALFSGTTRLVRPLNCNVPLFSGTTRTALAT